PIPTLDSLFYVAFESLQRIARTRVCVQSPAFAGDLDVVEHFAGVWRDRVQIQNGLAHVEAAMVLISRRGAESDDPQQNHVAVLAQLQTLRERGVSLEELHVEVFSREWLAEEGDDVVTALAQRALHRALQRVELRRLGQTNEDGEIRFVFSAYDV